MNFFNRLLFTCKALSKTDWIIISGYWILASPFILHDYIQLGGLVKAIALFLLNVLIDTTSIATLIYVIFPASMRKKNYWLPLLSMVIFFLAASIIYKLSYWYLFHYKSGWTMAAISKGLVNQAVKSGILLSVLAVRNFYAAQQKILLLQKANTENQLKALKGQLDPHFLFNNLNVLNALIQQNPAVATEYVKKLSDLYRYLIRHKDDDVVLLQNELDFADNYIFLLQQRFGNAYLFEKQINYQDALQQLVPSCCLQLLLENIVKHNRGDDTNPLKVRIEVDQKLVTVSNEIRPKTGNIEKSGTGLKNLRDRYALLSHKQINIETNGKYTVSLPLITQIK